MIWAGEITQWAHRLCVGGSFLTVYGNLRPVRNDFPNTELELLLKYCQVKPKKAKRGGGNPEENIDLEGWMFM